jgi:alcohol dehydrogenase
MDMMRAAVFVEKGKIELREVPKPVPGPGEALMKVTLTTICGTDVHILKGEYPVKPGLTVGHEPVGRIEALGAGVRGFAVGDRHDALPRRQDSMRIATRHQERRP